MREVFTRYDIRGDYPDEIDEAFAEQLGKAVGTYAVRNGRGKVVVGQDTREASEAVHPSFIDGAKAAGANIVDVGVGPTDRTALAAAHYGGIGVMVTASHHGWERTGFKLLYEEGNGFSNEDRGKVRDIFQEETFEEGSGTLLREQHEFDEAYIDTLKETFNDVAGPDLDGTVLIDTAGSAGRTAQAVFEELGADVWAHEWAAPPEPEPKEENRQAVVERAAESDVAVGYDPDGDRVYLVHPELGWIDGDRIFYALARIVGPDTVAASVDTSPMIEEAGAEVVYSRVGDIFVAASGMEADADLLGEPNGHYAVPQFSWYNSGIFASLLLASAAEQLPGILAEVDDYSTVRRTTVFDTEEERDEALSTVKKRVAEQYDVTSRIDGVKFRGDGFTGLVRPSGTSPKLRLVVHAASEGVNPERVAERLLP